MNQVNEKLDSELKNCFDVEPSNNFISNITSEAFKHEQKKGIINNLKVFLNQVAMEFSLPKSVITFASLLVLGFTVGFSFNSEVVAVDEQPELVSIFNGERGLI